MNDSRHITPLLLVVCAILMLSGCKSSRSSVRRGSGGRERVEQTSGKRHRDYSGEQTDQMGRDLVEEARRWMGTPYRYGGQDRSGTDCSGLVMQVYKNVCEVKLPRTTSDQRVYCITVPRDRTRVGDLVFFSSKGGRGSVSHVGLYIGNGEMIHASSSRGVTVSSVDTGYWGERFQGIGRVAGAPESWASLSRNRRRSKSRKGSDYSPSGSPASPLPVPPASVPVPSAPVSAPSGAPSISLSELLAASASASSQSWAASRPAAPEPVIESASPAVSDTVAIASAPTPVPDVSSLDILDALISEKVDSIFSAPFLD